MRKSELVRTGFKQKEKKPDAGPKKKKCAIKECRQEFVSDRPYVKFCSPECGYKLSQVAVAKKKAKDQRQERAETKAKLREYETIPQLKARLQVVFNLFCRMRDDLAGYPCICCGKWPKGDASLTGGQWDACHWKGCGSHDHLRYNEDNVHRGLKDCNKYGHTDYRGGLINRIGIDRVVALESYQPGGKWTREWLLAKIAEYSAKVKELKGKSWQP